MLIQKHFNNLTFVAIQSEEGQYLLRQTMDKTHFEDDITVADYSRIGMRGNDSNFPDRSETLMSAEIILISNEKTYRGAEAVIFLAEVSGGWMRILGRLAKIFPRGVRDFMYRVVASNRYRWFGTRQTCFLPTITKID